MPTSPTTAGSDGNASPTDRYRRLRQPIKVGNCEIRNRIVRTAHTVGFETGGKVTDRSIAYHRARAKGGAGLLILGVAPVHESTAKRPGRDAHSVALYTDDCIEGLARLADAVHAEGSRIFQQLFHGGPQALQIDWGPPWGPSDVTSPLYGIPVIPMTIQMIDALVEAFASAALRCKKAGLDGVEVHAAHGYLHAQFLGWATNRRTDEYGGSLINRTLFLRRCLTAVRAAVGPGYPVGVRLSGSEAHEDGLQSDEVAKIAEMLDQQGLVDFVDVSMGDYFTLDKGIGPMHEPICYEIPTSRPVTHAVKVPTIVTGRIMNLHDADRIVADGDADMVSMVRAMIADPDLPEKSFAGREDDVRPCISCNQGCVGGVLNPAINHITCTVNPGIGFESTDQFPATKSARRILVVGGGPAGLEAAYTAARRGHKVILCEASDSLGGAIVHARRAPRRADIGIIADYLVEQIGKLGVEVRYNTYVELDEVQSIAPDAVVVATGGEQRTSGRQRWRPGIKVPGIESSHVLAPADLLGGRGRDAKTAVIFDDMGHAAAVGAAEYLLQKGCSVTFATSFACVAAQLEITLQRGAVQGRLRSYDNFREFCRSSLLEVASKSAKIQDLDSGRITQHDADVVIVDTGVDPRQKLYHEVLDAGYEAHLVGDAMMPGDLQRAIATGRRVGQAIV